MLAVRKFLSFCVDGVDGVEGAAGKRQVSVEVATQYSFDGTLGYGLCMCTCMYTCVHGWVGVCVQTRVFLR